MRMNLFFILPVLLTALTSCEKKSPLDGVVDPSKAVIKPDASSSVKVMTYNIYGARGLYNDWELDALADVIKGQDPDFVLLQETDSATVRSKSHFHARDLGERCGMYYAYAVAWERPRNQDGTYGDAILSKYPFVQERDFHLGLSPQNPSTSAEPRSVCAVQCRVGDQLIWVASTHLDHAAEINRVFEADELQTIICDELQGHVIFGGDLNSTPSSAPMQKILTFAQPHYLAETQYTFPSQRKKDNPTSLLDYILTKRSDTKISCSGYKVVQNTASDHCAVVATFSLK